MRRILFSLSIVGLAACSKTQFTKTSGQEQGQNDQLNCVSNCDTNTVPPSQSVVQITDFTVSPSTKKVDILIVSDNSGSMDEDNKELGAKIGNLVSKLNEGGADWQMCFLNTDTSIGKGQAKAWAGTSSVVLKKSDPQAIATFKTMLSTAGSQGSGDEQAIAALSASLQPSSNAPCFRQDAALASIIISDEDERSCGGRCKLGPDTPSWGYHHSDDTYNKQFRSLNSENQYSGLIAKVKSLFVNKSYSNHSIIIQPGDTLCAEEQDAQSAVYYGIEYTKLSNATGGLVNSICASDYSTPLASIGTNINQSFNSVVLKCSVKSLKSILVDGKAAPAFTLAGDKIVFNSSLRAGSLVHVEYTCQ